MIFCQHLFQTCILKYGNYSCIFIFFNIKIVPVPILQSPNSLNLHHPTALEPHDDSVFKSSGYQLRSYSTTIKFWLIYVLLSYSPRAEIHAMELPRTIYSPQYRKLYLVSREHCRIISKEHCREIQCVPEYSIIFSYMVRGFRQSFIRTAGQFWR